MTIPRELRLEIFATIHDFLEAHYDCDCPRIDPEWLAEERRLVGDWQFQQEYLCEFVDTDEQFFASDLIEAALSDEVTPLWA